jgi:outer membrane receptor protein involved in Fe transport
MTVGALAVPAAAQAPPVDTSHTLNAVVVTADRARTPLSGSIASVTRLSSADLARAPRATLADLLRRAPGFTVIDFDGLGFDPQLMVRGFYGGGEAEYVAVMVDGRAVSQLHTGLVAWDVLPPVTSIESIEVVRGSASPLYGDAAVGGVINVLTHAAKSGARMALSGGAFGTASASFDGSFGSRFGIGGGVDRTDGFRAHSRRTSTRARVNHALVENNATRVNLTGRAHWREFDEPGPLLASLMDADRRSSDPLFRFDHTTDQSQSVGLDAERRTESGRRLSASIGGEHRQTNAIRTLALAPGFGDTKLRKARTLRASGEAQIEIGQTLFPWTDSFLFGFAGSYGTLDSRYYDVAGGPRVAYAAASGEAGAQREHGNDSRLAGAMHAQYTVLPTDALRISVGGRLDGWHDESQPSAPSTLRSTGETRSAFSPRAGVNLRYMEGERSSGNVYATVSRSFKAATLDQLYDLRAIPVPFEPFEVRTSNGLLEPQSGTNLEAGVYQNFGLGSSTRASASLSAYRMDMKNELDFDVAQFKYVNIGRSRHRGIEAGANVERGGASLFATYTLQDAVSKSGDNAGKHLKAIPLHTISAGASAMMANRVDLSVLAANMREMYLDDANSTRLPNYTRIDARAGVRVRGLDLFADVRNVLDTRYSSSGFLDPAGTGEAYYYPAAGRTLALGLKREW